MPASSLTTTPTTPARLNSTRHNGRPGKLPAHLQGRQVGYERCCLELQHVPFGPSLSHLRMLELQVEDLPAVCVKGLGKFNILTTSLGLSTRHRKAVIT
jgi:hypothetical protein